jgi:TonB family protein
MYFDFDDYRPDTPSLTAPMTRREAVLLALLAHALVVIAYLVMPADWFQVSQVVPVSPQTKPELVYTRIEPLRELPRAPKAEAPPSDLDRRASAVEKPPPPKEPDPFSKGNTPDKVEAAPVERARGPETRDPATTPTPPAPPTTQPQPTDSGLLNVKPELKSSGGLGESLKNLQQFIKRDNFDNPQGGNTDTDAAIQFDSKGVDFGDWLRRFEVRVRRNWLIPKAAETFHGRVVITFNVHRNGALTEIQVVKVSGIDSFDSAAFIALKLSNPVDPLPAGYPDDKVLFTVTFIYRERIR